MQVRKNLIDTLWYGQDPMEGFPAGEHPADHQGWNSDHVYLSDSIEKVRPSIVVEVGVWKGGSVKTMASKAKSLSLDCAVIAIDTWLGSTEHWLSHDLFMQLRSRFGYPQLYHTFMKNIIEKDLQDYVVPLPLDSINALHLLQTKGIVPDVLHIDAGHDYQAATSDLENWWPLLRKGGILVGDDYYTDGIHWQEVRRAFDDFFARTPHDSFESGGGKCMITKPST